MINARRRSKISKLRDSDIVKRVLPGFPNIRLRLHLKSKSLNAQMCDELKEILKLEVDLTESKLQIGSTYQRYKWEFRVKDAKQFKRALSEYSTQHPEIDIFSDDLRWHGPILQYTIYTVGIVATIIRLIF